MKAPRVLTLLLAEDSPSDVRLFHEALAAAGVQVTLQHVWSGQETLDYLRRRGAHAGAPRPDVLVLDMDLPVLSGREVLVEMAGDPGLGSIPVVILTGSPFESGAEALYPPDRCLFVVKPRHFRDLVEVVRSTARFAASFLEPSDQAPTGAHP